MSHIQKLYKFLLRPIYNGLQLLDHQMVTAQDLPWLLTSPLWDEGYYLHCHLQDVLDSELTPAEHYLRIGWKKGFNPSEYFDGNAYLEHQTWLHSNPLVHFLKYGRFQYCYGFFRNVYPAKPGTVERYQEAKTKRTASKVVYTCITNDYDDLNEIAAYRYVDPEWDYVCFSDNPKLVEQKTWGIWDIRPLAFTELDAPRNNRWHKMHPHVLFPEYQESIYIDANINILTSYLSDTIQERQANLLLPMHTWKDCLYAELDWLTESGCDLEQVAFQRQQFQASGFPQHWGFTENNVIYRKHHVPSIIALMEDWWSWVRDHCCRDQASFMYVLWRHLKTLPSGLFLNNTRSDYRNFCIFTHRKARYF